MQWLDPFAEAFVVGVSVLDDDRGDLLGDERLPGGIRRVRRSPGRRSRNPVKFYCLRKVIDDLGEMIERVIEFFRGRGMLL